MKMDRIYTNQNFLHCVSSFESITICKIQSLDLLFLVIFISFYISRYFSQVVELHSTLSEKKFFFRDRFSFLTDSLNTHPTPFHHHPLNSQNPLSATKVFSQCSLTYQDYYAMMVLGRTRTAEQN